LVSQAYEEGLKAKANTSRRKVVEEEMRVLRTISREFRATKVTAGKKPTRKPIFGKRGHSVVGKVLKVRQQTPEAQCVIKRS